MQLPPRRPEVASARLNTYLDFVQAFVFTVGQVILVVLMVATTFVALNNATVETLTRLGIFLH
jgi:hypothetical protein